jgi:hypothetical protein
VVFFLADTLERCTIFFTIHEPARVSIALCPCLSFRVIGLRTLSYSAISVTVTFRGIGCHLVSPFLEVDIIVIFTIIMVIIVESVF